MPKRHPPLPAPLTGVPFTPGDAREWGLTRRRMSASDIAHPHHGVYSSAASGDLFGACEAALPLLGGSRWFSHLTAARLWGVPVPLPWRDGEPLHVLSLGAAEPLRRPGIVGWGSGDHPGDAFVGPLPMVSPAGVWAQLSVPGALGIDPETGRRRALSVDWLVAAGDYLVTGPFRRRGGRVPLCNLDDLAAAGRAHRGKRGAKALAAALPLVRVGPQSPRESLLRLALVDQGLSEPVVQPPVQTRAGMRHSDLGYPDRGVLIEYHGDHHRTDAAQWREDLTRQQLFEDAGYRVLVATLDDLADGCRSFAARVRRALA